MKPWKRIDPTIVQKVGWRTIVTKTFLKPNGEKVEFTTMNEENSHCAGVIALTKENLVIVAKEYRVGQEKVMMEIPGGVVEGHEVRDFEVAARRELKEETGYTAGSMSFLGSIHKDAYNNTTWHFFWAENCELNEEGQQLDEHEVIEVDLISIEQFIKNAKDGMMTDTEAVFLAYDKLKKKMDSK